MWTTSHSTTDTLGHTVQNTWLIVANWKLRRHADFLVQLFCVWKLSAYQLRLFKVIHSWAVVIMGVTSCMSNSCHCHFRCSVPVMRYSMLLLLLQAVVYHGLCGADRWGRHGDFRWRHLWPENFTKHPWNLLDKVNKTQQESWKDSKNSTTSRLKIMITTTIATVVIIIINQSNPIQSNPSINQSINQSINSHHVLMMFPYFPINSSIYKKFPSEPCLSTEGYRRPTSAGELLAPEIGKSKARSSPWLLLRYAI